MTNSFALALIAFVNERPNGNILREIAERALVDLQQGNFECQELPKYEMPKYACKKTNRFKAEADAYEKLQRNS